MKPVVTTDPKFKKPSKKNPEKSHMRKHPKLMWPPSVPIGSPTGYAQKQFLQRSAQGLATPQEDHSDHGIPFIEIHLQGETSGESIAQWKKSP